MVDIPCVMTYAIWWRSVMGFRDGGARGGRILPLPVDFDRRPYYTWQFRSTTTWKLLYCLSVSVSRLSLDLCQQTSTYNYCCFVKYRVLLRTCRWFLNVASVELTWYMRWSRTFSLECQSVFHSAHCHSASLAVYDSLWLVSQWLLSITADYRPFTGNLLHVIVHSTQPEWWISTVVFYVN